MVVDEFTLKAMVEQEDDDILISKVRSIRSSSNSQNDKLIAALQVAIIVDFIYAHFSIRLTSCTWSLFETSRPKSLKVGKCTKTIRSGWSHNSNLSQKKAQSFNAQFKTDPGS